MAWFYLIVAGFLEVGWAVFLKETDGFTRLWPSAIVLVLGESREILRIVCLVLIVAGVVGLKFAAGPAK
jgi:multidrug transporter EmrE-like cation transporter